MKTVEAMCGSRFKENAYATGPQDLPNDYAGIFLMLLYAPVGRYGCGSSYRACDAASSIKPATAFGLET